MFLFLNNVHLFHLLPLVTKKWHTAALNTWKQSWCRVLLMPFRNLTSEKDSVKPFILSQQILASHSNVLKKATHGFQVEILCTPAVTALLFVHLWIQCLCDLLNRDITFVSQFSSRNNVNTLMTESSITHLFRAVERERIERTSFQFEAAQNASHVNTPRDRVIFKDCNQYSAPTFGRWLSPSRQTPK